MCIYMAGVVNYCVPAGEAYQKALELAREINQKVRSHWNNYVLQLTKKDQFCHLRIPSNTDTVLSYLLVLSSLFELIPDRSLPHPS